MFDIAGSLIGDMVSNEIGNMVMSAIGGAIVLPKATGLIRDKIIMPIVKKEVDENIINPLVKDVLAPLQDKENKILYSEKITPTSLLDKIVAEIIRRAGNAAYYFGVSLANGAENFIKKMPMVKDKEKIRNGINKGAQVIVEMFSKGFKDTFSL